MPLSRKNRCLAQILVEFALILPLTLSMLTAVIEVGLYLQRYIAVQVAVREGALVAVQPHATDARIKAAVIGACSALRLEPDDVRITRIPFDPQLATLTKGGGESVSPKDRVPSYETVEVRVETLHSAVIPIFYRGQPLTKVVGCIKTLAVTSRGD